MTQDKVDIAETYRQLAEAEIQALYLEKMLDSLDSKMDGILREVDESQTTEEQERNQDESPKTAN